MPVSKKLTTKEELKILSKRMDKHHEILIKHIVPLQKFLGYVVAFILIILGIAIMIYSASANISEGDNQEDIRNQGYMIGGSKIAAGFIKIFIVYFWTKKALNFDSDL